MTLYIIRHGETAGNAERIVQFPDVELNQRGLQQAQRLGQRLAACGVNRIISSDYRRAQMTAEAIQQASGAELQLSADWRERHFGDLRGQKHSDIGDLYHPDLDPPNGESWAVFHARIDRAWSEVHHHLNTSPLAIVTHGLVCYSLALRHLQLPPQIRAHTDFRNTSVTEVEPIPPWRVVVLNCTTHLDDPALTPTDSGGV